MMRKGMGIIDPGRARQPFFNRSSIGALIMGLIFSTTFYFALAKIHAEEDTHPIVDMLLPVAGIMWLGSMLPLLMFLADQEAFKNLNPLVPDQYLKVFKMAYKAMIANNGKVAREKDM